MTHYFEDLKVGQTETMSHTVTERDVELFGEATGDMNPLHFDEAYARKTIFRGRVAHGALAIGYISAVMGTKLPGPGSIFLSANIRFKAPVRIGDTVITTATVAEIHQRREVMIACTCEVNGKLVVEAEGLVMAPKKPRPDVA
ncbi:MAG TPA: MaoC family dehydratase [Rhizomicrobium sp.]|nr:MaoC family dehydratase [Rhizomicrobium sp.]